MAIDIPLIQDKSPDQKVNEKQAAYTTDENQPPNGICCNINVQQCILPGKQDILKEDMLSSKVGPPKPVRRTANLPPQTPEAVARRQLLVKALGQTLLQLSKEGEGKPFVQTMFHTVEKPAQELGAYLARIGHYFFCSDAALVMGLVYVDRVMKLQPKFVLGPHSLHRLVAMSLTTAAKFFDDDFFSNSYYGRVSGICQQEFNRLELQFLQLIEYKLHIQPEEYACYHAHLAKLCCEIQAISRRAAAARCA